LVHDQEENFEVECSLRRRQHNFMIVVVFFNSLNGSGILLMVS
jgi:hypothetical protein